MSEPGAPAGPGGVSALAAQVQATLDEAAWNYLAGGSGDQHTVRRNLDGWASLRLLPRMLVGAGPPDPAVTLLGHHLRHPILVAPTASHGLYHQGAEAETRRGADAAGALPVVSTNASLAVDEVGAAATGPWWFQLYLQRDRGFTRGLVARAEGAGASALMLTADLPVQAPDTAARRTAVGAVEGSVYGNLRGLDALGPGDPGPPRTNDPGFDPTLSWADVDWLRGLTDLPVLVKGLLRADDAERAIDHGVAGIVVSNHGGRALDGTPATADVLPGVLEQVAGRVPVLVDGGIRRGTDVAAAVALGAAAVLVGRPIVWGLTLGGADGVRDVLETLRRELETAMALLGAPTLADLTPDLVWLPR